MEERLYILRPANWQKPDHYEVMAGEWANVKPLMCDDDGGPADELKVGDHLATFESGDYINGVLVQDQTVIMEIKSVDFVGGEVRIRALVMRVKAAIDFEHEPDARCLAPCQMYLDGLPCSCMREREVADETADRQSAPIHP